MVERIRGTLKTLTYTIMLVSCGFLNNESKTEWFLREGAHMDFRKELKERMLIGDGAMGTLLYSRGIDNCYEELNCTEPDQIEAIHRAYLEAGADILQSNTYGANFHKLKRYGLEDEVSQINRQGIAIAKKVAKGKHLYLERLVQPKYSKIRYKP